MYDRCCSCGTDLYYYYNHYIPLKGELMLIFPAFVVHEYVSSIYPARVEWTMIADRETDTRRSLLTGATLRSLSMCLTVLRCDGDGGVGGKGEFTLIGGGMNHNTPYGDNNNNNNIIGFTVHPPTQFVQSVGPFDRSPSSDCLFYGLFLSTNGLRWLFMKRQAVGNWLQYWML